MGGVGNIYCLCAGFWTGVVRGFAFVGVGGDGMGWSWVWVLRVFVVADFLQDILEMLSDLLSLV